MAKVWYSPGEIRFTRQQVLFLIRNLLILREGSWPAEASSYVDIPGKKTGRHKAYFETPIEYAAEIQSRLEKAGIDGLILEAIECWDKSEASMANYLRMPEWSVRNRYKRVLAFVAGWRRKPSYENFRKNT